MSQAEQIRRTFATAWGEIGAAWGVAPSTAAVHGYLLAQDGAMTEPEIRKALGLSHRAASLALGQCEDWGLVEREAVSRRSGQRGPAATAYAALRDHWEWFRRVITVRKERETDPVIPVIERCVQMAREASHHGDDAELALLTTRLDDLHDFVRRFDAGVGAIAQADTRGVEHLFAVIVALDGETMTRLWALAADLAPNDLSRSLDALSRLSPSAIRRLLSLAEQPALGKLLGVR